MKCSWISSGFPYSCATQDTTEWFVLISVASCVQNVMYNTEISIWSDILLFLVPSFNFSFSSIRLFVWKVKFSSQMLESFDFFFKFSAERQKLYTSKNQACLFSAWNMAAEISMMSRNILLLDSIFLCTRLVRSL